MTRICSIEGCSKPIKCKDLCNAHYKRKLRHGAPTLGGTMKGQPQAFYEAALVSETDECIIWPHAKGPFGYGNMQKDGEKVQVYREVCTATHGPRPPGMEATHRCGRHECINPRHLRWATHQQNMCDRDRHGRTAHGEKIPNSKLTNEMVLRARQLRSTHAVKDIAAMFGVSPSTMSRVIRGERWKHVA